MVAHTVWNEVKFFHCTNLLGEKGAETELYASASALPHSSLIRWGGTPAISKQAIGLVKEDPVHSYSHISDEPRHIFLKSISRKRRHVRLDHRTSPPLLMFLLANLTTGYSAEY